MERIKIKKLTLNDIEPLQKIGRQTFFETFSSVNTEENMKKYLDEKFSIEQLATELSNKNSEFYFALRDNKVIGYLKLNIGESQTELKDDNALEIERIYVLREFHGKKVGQTLYNKAIQIAQQVNAAYVWLGVWEENPRAISFYKKNGFTEFGKHIFKLGDDEQTDIMMKKIPVMNTQPVLENERLILYPLQKQDFEALYAVAKDPKIWEQHPNKDRWKEEVFRTFFDGAMQSKGAFKIVDKAAGNIIGSTRFYDYNKQDDSILIGYTFYAVAYWGTGFNRSAKAMMLDYIFQFVSKVYFHIGAGNTRSQIAIGRIGAEKIAEKEITYFGEAPKLNFIYEIRKEQWKCE